MRRDQLEHAVRRLNSIFNAALNTGARPLLFANGGPVTTPEDLEEVYRHTSLHGFIGGAAFETLPINDIVAAFESPEAAALGMTVAQEHPAWGVIRQVGIPFALSETPASIRRPPPTLGEHTDEILASLGYDPAAIADLRARSVV